VIAVPVVKRKCGRKVKIELFLASILVPDFEVEPLEEFPSFDTEFLEFIYFVVSPGTIRV
jgi:hypothetical protein